MSVDRWDTDGDWTADPWFLRPDVGWTEEWRALGLPRDVRRKAVEGLRRIFPPEVCRTIRDDPSLRRYRSVIFLFDTLRMPGLVAPLLRLGLDAVETKPWEDAGLLHRLHCRGEHEEAAFELRVQAALLRAGFGVQRIPETPARRTPDFRVSARGATFDVEVKLLNRSELDQIAEDLNRLLWSRELIVTGLQLTLRGSEAFAEEVLSDPKRVRERLVAIADAYESTALRIRAAPAPGTYAVEGYGSIIATPRDGLGSVTNLTLPELPEEKKAQRVLRLVRRGLPQLSGEHPGVLLVGLSRLAHPLEVEALAAEAAKTDKGLRGCSMLVLCDSLEEPPGASSVAPASPIFHAFSPGAYRRLRRVELELATAAAATSVRPAARVRVARPGDVEVSASYARRPPQSLVHLGTTELKSGQRAVFTFNGLGEASVKVLSAEDESQS